MEITTLASAGQVPLERHVLVHLQHGVPSTALHLSRSAPPYKDATRKSGHSAQKERTSGGPPWPGRRELWEVIRRGQKKILADQWLSISTWRLQLRDTLAYPEPSAGEIASLDCCCAPSGATE